MDQRTHSASADLDPGLDEDAAQGPESTDDPSADPSAPRLSLEGLTVGGFTRRRAAWLVGALVTVWIVIVFARQVGDASAVAVQADQARVANAAVAANVIALQRELDLVQRPDYILQQARGLGLGTAKDHAFVLAPGAPPLPSNAPGSAALRLGAPASSPSPLDSWLQMLFGPPPGG
ncbi:MAG: hypothetical protein ACYDAK_08265 [Candidatus Limnocylindrales bacterium]